MGKETATCGKPDGVMREKGRWSVGKRAVRLWINAAGAPGAGL